MGLSCTNLRVAWSHIISVCLCTDIMWERSRGSHWARNWFPGEIRRRKPHFVPQDNTHSFWPGFLWPAFLHGWVEGPYPALIPHSNPTNIVLPPHIFHVNSFDRVPVWWACWHTIYHRYSKGYNPRVKVQDRNQRPKTRECHQETKKFHQVIKGLEAMTNIWLISASRVVNAWDILCESSGIYTQHSMCRMAQVLTWAAVSLMLFYSAAQLSSFELIHQI